MRVTIPSPLHHYTNRREVEAGGATLADVISNLDRQFPGFGFRIVDEQGHLRPHMRVFLGSRELRDLARRSTRLRHCTSSRR